MNHLHGRQRIRKGGTTIEGYYEVTVEKRTSRTASIREKEQYIKH